MLTARGEPRAQKERGKTTRPREKKRAVVGTNILHSSLKKNEFSLFDVISSSFWPESCQLAGGRELHYV
jgi:hypothetical protein